MKNIKSFRQILQEMEAENPIEQTEATQQIKSIPRLLEEIHLNNCIDRDFSKEEQIQQQINAMKAKIDSILNK